MGVSFYSIVAPATNEVQELADRVKEEIESREGRPFETFKAVLYINRFVGGGYHYRIKVNTGAGYLILGIFRRHEEVSVTEVEQASFTTLP